MEVTERTPLVDNHSTTESLPCVSELEKAIYSDAEYPATHRVIERKVEDYTTSPSLQSMLKLLLCLRYLSGIHVQVREDWMDSRSVEEEVTDLAQRCWSDLQRVVWSQAALDEALWTQFRLDTQKRGNVSLIETILSYRGGMPLSIQLDDRVALSLLRVWKNGRPRSAYADRSSILDTVLGRLGGLITPRALHLLDITFFFVYIIIYSMFVVKDGPVISSAPPDFHFYCISTYAASRILRDPWHSGTSATFGLTLLMFLVALPSMPSVHHSSYNTLLFLFLLHFLLLLMPLGPSVPLLEPNGSYLSVSTMFRNLFAVVVLPGLKFFVPTFFLMLALLLASLRDFFMLVGNMIAFDVFLFITWSTAQLFACLLFYLTLCTTNLPPATVHHPAVPPSWNAYGTNVGVSLRHHFSRSVSIYSAPYYFPAPLNLLPFIFVSVPCFVLRLLRREKVALLVKSTVEPVLWRLLVFPPGLIMGLFYIWN